MSNFKQGKFIPKNPEKYMGNVSNVVYRSSWEYKFMQFLDYQPEVISWSSEEIVIPYFFEYDNKYHRYFPDFYFVKNNANGSTSKYMIEIKPKKDTEVKKPKKLTNKSKMQMLESAITVSKNEAKWKAAKEWCIQREVQFMVLTEDELFKK